MGGPHKPPKLKVERDSYSAAVMSLLADPKVEGNVWCDPCQQSLLASRAAAHLVSKKHTDKTAGKPADKAASKPTGKAPSKTPSKAGSRSPDGSGEDGSPVAAEVKAAPAEAKPKSSGSSKRGGVSSNGLIVDPDDPIKFWCGICKVSLAKAQADKHLDTKSHADKALKHLEKSMKATKISEK